MKKKIVAILCGLCLISSMLPMGNVHAEEEAGGAVTEQPEQTGEEQETVPSADVVDGVEINETNFPDANFRDYVKTSFDKDGDGELSEAEINAVTNIQVDNKGISDLAGIEYFAGLQILSCNRNQLTYLDVSQNTALESLSCYNNCLPGVDLSNNKALKSFKWDSGGGTGGSSLSNFRDPFGGASSSQDVKITANYNNGQWMIDFSQLVGKDNLSKVEVTDYDYNPETGILVIPFEDYFLMRFEYKFLTGGPENVFIRPYIRYKSDSIANKIVYDNNSVDISKIDINAIYESLGIGAEPMVTILNVWAGWWYYEGVGDELIGEALKDYAKNEGYSVRDFFNVSMRLITSNNTDHYIDNNFGSITPVVYVGEKYAGQTVAVYQFMGENAGIRAYKDLIVDESGRISITASELGSNIFALALQNSADAPGGGADATIKTDTNGIQVKSETGGVDVAGICKAHGIDPKSSDVEILIQQRESSEKNVSYLTGISNKAGDTLLKAYDIEMLLKADGKSYGLVTDNFGKLTLSLYAGKEHAGKTATVYQLHGENEVITHKDLKVDENGMVSITVSKLSTFAVALQKETTTSGQGTTSSTATPGQRITSPKTGENNNMIPWISVMVLSMGALVFIATGKIRKVKR